MLHTNDHAASTLIVTTDWLAITHLNGATTFRLTAETDAAALVGAVVGLIDRRTVTLTRILLDVPGPKAGMYRRAAVAIADALGALVGEITELGRQHIAALVGTPQRNRAAWIAEGLSKARDTEPLAKSAGVQMSPVFEIAGLPTAIYTEEQRAQRIRSLLTECRRMQRFWRNRDNADLYELAECY